MKLQHLILVTLLALLVSCKGKKQATPEEIMDNLEMMSQHFLSYPKALISVGEEFVFILSEPLETMATAEELSKFFSIFPQVNAEIRMENNALIKVTPGTLLKSDTEYTISINLNAIKPDYTGYVISYPVKTNMQYIELSQPVFIINDDQSVSVFVTTNCSDVVNAGDLKACFSTATKEISISELSPTSFLVEFLFAKGIPSGGSIQFDGKAIQSDLKEKIELFDINMDIFQVFNAVYDNESKELKIYFSQILDEKQELKGLIKADKRDLNFLRKQNELTIYIPSDNMEEKLSVRINKSIRSISKQTLDNDFIFEIDLIPPKPELKFLDNGHYIPSDGEFKVPIASRGLNAAKMAVVEIQADRLPYILTWYNLQYLNEHDLIRFGKLIYTEKVSLKTAQKDNDGWSTFGIDLSGKFAKNSGNMYMIFFDFGPQDIQISCSEQIDVSKYAYKIPKADRFSKKDYREYWNSYYYYDDYYYDDYYYDDYDWNNRNNPCKLSYYNNKSGIQKAIMCTDYGYIAKMSERECNISVVNLKSAAPESGVYLQLLDLQGDLMATSRTDNNGLARFTNLSKPAYTVKMEKSGSVSFFKLDDHLSLTDFEISGDRSESEISWYAYSERDVYRPGDDIHVNLMLNRRMSDIPNELPIKMSFFNPENSLMAESTQKYEEGKWIYSFKLNTKLSDKTGLYRCDFRIGPQKIQKYIRVETIRPNTTSIDFVPDNLEDKTIYSDFIKGKLHLKHLTGYDIAGAQINAEAKAKAIPNPFSKFRNFHFDEYWKQDFGTIALFSVTTSTNGTASFLGDFDFKELNAPVSLSLEFQTTLPEGGVNTEVKRFTVNPMSSYVGIKRNEGSAWGKNYYLKDKKIIELVNLDKKGKILNRKKSYNYAISRHERYWWVDSYRFRSQSQYMSEYNWKQVKAGTVDLNGQGNIDISSDISQDGAYLFTIIDPESGHKSQLYFNVSAYGRVRAGSEAFILPFGLDKEECVSGENVEVQLPGIEGAKALISVEQGDKVLEQKWVSLSDKESVHTIKSNESWTPNVYVHVSVIQPYMQANNDLPLRLYGIQNLKVNPVKSRLQPTIQTTDKYESNKSYEVKIKEKEGRRMQYTLAVVDEGLLSLTGYQTPNPANYFSGKFPLLVKTSDMYNLLIRYYKAKFAGIMSIGGDGTYNPDALPEIQRFEPVVLHLGPFDLKTGGENTHSINIPNYIGKVRVMVVACNEDNFGNAEKNVEVKNPLMVQSIFPKALNVSDVFKLPVNIIRDDASVKTLTLKARADAGFLDGLKGSVNLNFPREDQFTHYYDIKVLDQAGAVNVEIEAISGNKSMKENTLINVNYPHAYQPEREQMIISPGETKEIIVNSKGVASAFKAEILFGGKAIPDFSNKKNYLITYPYGCLEQTSSGAFALLHLDKITQLSAAEKADRELYLRAYIGKLNEFVRADGSFSYWRNGYYESWSDIYAGHIMVELMQDNFMRSTDPILNRWLGVHFNRANSWRYVEKSGELEYQLMLQAYRLFVLAQGGKPAKSAMNLFMSSYKPNNRQTLYLMAGAYKLSGYDAKAKEILETAEKTEDNLRHSYWYFGDEIRNIALALRVLSLFDDLKSKQDLFYDKLVEMHDKNPWVSTQTLGWTFTAINQYIGGQVTKSNVQYSLNMRGKTEEFGHIGVRAKTVYLNTSDWGKKMTVVNTGKTKLYVTINSRYVPTELSMPAESRNVDLSASWFVEGSGRSHTQGFKPGENVVVAVTVKNTSGLPQENLALNVKMPSGLELLNPGLSDLNYSGASDASIQFQEYRDDRVYTFFQLRPGESRRFEFRAKAAFEGDFFMPAVVVEHMYNNQIYARTKTDRLSIKK
jgi:alpha-2-macroglobulin